MEHYKNKKYPVAQRNDQLKRLFESLGYSTRLLGDENQPKIIIDDDFAVSGFVHNRTFNFTSKPFMGSIIASVDLNNPTITKHEVDEIFRTYKQRRFWRLRLRRDYSLFFLKTENSIPMFACGDSRFWFDQSRAKDTQSYLSEVHGINCELVTSSNGNLTTI